MSKQEQLIEYTIQDIVQFIVEDRKIDFDQAMHMFYDSHTFDKLQDLTTGLYTESPAYVYGIFQDEQNFGRLIQAEI